MSLGPDMKYSWENPAEDRNYTPVSQIQRQNLSLTQEADWLNRQ